VTSEPKSTPAPFQPNDRRWLKRFNAIEILGVLVGLAACSTGTIGTIIGVPVILAALYSAFFIPPKINRGFISANAHIAAPKCRQRIIKRKWIARAVAGTWPCGTAVL